jgi:hypothetical protein
MRVNPLPRRASKDYDARQRVEIAEATAPFEELEDGELDG